MFVVFREERVAWRRCAHVLLKSRHSSCMVNHTDLVVNGNFVEQSMMSDKEVVRTTDSIDCETNEQIWHVVSLHFALFRLEWSEGKMAVPAIWRAETWYLLTVDRKVYSRRLTENSPRHMSVRTQHGLIDCYVWAVVFDCFYWQSLYFTRHFRCFALKNPESSSLLSSLETYKVAPIPGLRKAPSVTIQKVSFEWVY